MYLADHFGFWCIMKSLLIFACSLIVLLIITGGCTSQPAQPVPTLTPLPTVIVTVPPITPETPITLTGQGWNLGWYDDTKGVWSSVIDGSAVSIWFGNTGNISGSAGCTKYYSAAYQIGDPGKIIIRRPDVNITGCQAPTGVISQDSQYFTDLEWTTSYQISGDQLFLFDQKGKKILQFDRMD
jgi:heat shock protein HslJ